MEPLQIFKINNIIKGCKTRIDPMKASAMLSGRANFKSLTAEQIRHIKKVIDEGYKDITELLDKKLKEVGNG